LCVLDRWTEKKTTNRAGGIYQIEDPDVIRLCIKRLGIKQEDFDEYMKIPPKTFKDYPTSRKYMELFQDAYLDCKPIEPCAKSSLRQVL